MNYSEVVSRLEHLRELVDKQREAKDSDEAHRRAISRRIYETYGEVEDVYKRFTAGRRVVIKDGSQVNEFETFFEAGYLSGRTFHRHEGYTELNKVIGAVRRLAGEPTQTRDERTIGTVIESLQRFRECCQYLKAPPSDEAGVQDIIWIILRSRFDRLDREDSLPKFGVKGYRPDFGIPEQRLLIEVKYIGTATRPAQLQEEVLADIPGYLSANDRYNGIIVFIYDAAHKLRDPRKFIEDLRSVTGILDVLVTPGIG